MESIKFEKLILTKENIIEKNIQEIEGVLKNIVQKESKDLSAEIKKINKILIREDIHNYIEDCLSFLKYNLYESKNKNIISYEIVKILFEKTDYKYRENLKKIISKMYFYSKKRDNSYFLSILEENKIELKTNIKSEYSWVNEVVENYKKEMENYNLNKIVSLNKLYELAVSMERGRGFYNKDIDLLIHLINKSDCSGIQRICDNIKDLVKLIMINNCLKENMIFVAKNSSNLLVKIEAVRNIDNYFNKDDEIFLSSENEEGYQIIILELINSEKWEENLNYFIKMDSFGFLFILGKILADINEEKQLYIVENIRYQNLNMNSDYTLESERKYNYLFKDIIKLSDIVREKIEKSYIKEISDLEIVLSLIFNNMTTNLLNMFYNHGYDLKKIEKKIEELDEIDNLWFENSLEKTKDIFKKYSYLFVISASLVNLKENSEKKKELIKKLEENIKKLEFEIKKEIREDFPLIQTFRSYIFSKI